LLRSDRIAASPFRSDLDQTFFHMSRVTACTTARQFTQRISLLLKHDWGRATRDANLLQSLSERQPEARSRSARKGSIAVRPNSISTPTTRNKQGIRSGTRVKLFHLMQSMYLDQLTMAGGEGSQILKRIKSGGVQNYRHRHGWRQRRQ
jgi:hypothetical protein